MFNGYGVLNLDADHLDLSYRNPDAWPNVTPGGAVKALMFDFGDPTAGPVAQLGLMRPVDADQPDWERIDPPHFHGSDQFRLVSAGEWTLANKPMVTGSYAFQEAGRGYREHVGASGAAWLLLVVGDRRGIRPTIVRDEDRAKLFDVGGGEYNKPAMEGEPYPHPAGPKGSTAIAVTRGSRQLGYLRGSTSSLADETPAAVTGVLGDQVAGPVVHLVKYLPGEVVIPASTYATERLIVVAAGSCKIGDAAYQAGDMRVQRSDCPMQPVISGEDGLEACFVIADRRAPWSVGDSVGARTEHWIFDGSKVLCDLPPKDIGA
jgi:hypothetical protein